MELTKREKTIKYVIFCLVIAAFSLLQNVGGLWFEIGGARCFFLIPVCVILGMDEDEKVSALLGLFAGFLWDAVSAHHMGFNGVYLMVLCYITSALVTFVFRDTFWIEFSASAIITFIYVLAYWLIFVLRKGNDGSAISFLNFYFPSFIYTVALMPILYLILTPLKRRLNREPKEN